MLKCCEFQILSLKFLQTEKSFSFFHINACSLNKRFDYVLLKSTNKSFDIIAVSETRISKRTSQTYNVNLNNYSFESTTTESTAGGAMLYLSNRLCYKSRIDLSMYKKFSRIYFY